MKTFKEYITEGTKALAQLKAERKKIQKEIDNLIEGDILTIYFNYNEKEYSAYAEIGESGTNNEANEMLDYILKKKVIRLSFEVDTEDEIYDIELDKISKISLEID